MIKLSDRLPFAEGSTRKCFVHPHDNGKVIKIVKPGRCGEAKRRYAPWYKRFLAPEFFDDNAHDLQGHQYFASLNNERIWDHIPCGYGSVETDLGSGVVGELLRSYNGEIALNFADYIREKGELSQVDRDALLEFDKFMRKHAPVSISILPFNFVMRFLSPNSYRLYLVEGFGPREWIPLAKWSRFIARRKVARKMARFHRRVACEVARANDGRRRDKAD